MAEIRQDVDGHRFEIRVDDELAGITTYKLRDDTIMFMHTEIEDRFGGQGLASQLIRFALDTAREQGRSVLPYCPFVKAYIQKHPEYTDLVPESRRATFDL